MLGQLLIDRYLILHELEQGGFSTTYLARDRFAPQYSLCVVKCVPLDQSNHEFALSLRQKVKHEAEILHQLGRVHDQVPWLLAYVEDEHQICLVMDYIDGEPLDRIEQLRTTDAIITLLKDVLSVLDFVHAHHVIHQDIKLGNLIRRRTDGKIVLIDFGSALQPNVGSPSIVRFGTPGYCPIEQQEGNSVYSSDLYAMGVCAIQLLIGIEPTQLRLNTTGNGLDWHDDLKDQIDPHLVAILDRLVKIRVSDRYQSASEVLMDLQRFSEAQVSRKIANLTAHASYQPFLRRV
jgi:serine/threonine protein kinase